MKQRVKRTLIEWRRSRLINEVAKGRTLTSLAQELQVSVPTLSRDLAILKRQAKDRQTQYIEDLPWRHQLSIKNLDNALAEYWTLFSNETDTRTKKSILDSITECVLKLQILHGDPARIEEALKAVARVRAEIAESRTEKHEEEEL